MFKAQCVTVRDPFHPMRGREIKTLDCAAPISALAPETSQPFIILRNGQAVLRADWNQPVADGDLMAVVLLPQGDDGGSDVTRIILMIIVVVISYWFPPAAGLTGWQAAAASAAINIAGAVLINAILPPPSAANAGGSSDTKLMSPTYNISAQGNAARLGGAIPVQYGRLNVYPDFAAAPYVEYAGNEQYLYQLLCIGVGEYEIEQIRIEDTDIANFEEITYEIVQPNQPLSLFPAAVGTSVEVSGQEMVYDTEIGPFIVNNAGTLANRLSVDVVCPRGLYYATDSGALNPKSITFEIKAQTVDDDGVAVGSWVTLATETVTGATSTPQRFTFSYSVANDRYQVKVKRTTVKDESTRAGHEIVWAGLRANLAASTTFGDVTLLAMRIRATNNISQQAARKVNVTCTRKMYIWNGLAWIGPHATRSPAWALYDACRTVGLPDSRIDLDSLLAMDATWSARGDKFDGRFDSTGTFWENISKIAQAGRCKPYVQGGIVHFMRDEAVLLPVALYSMRNIARGSFSINFITTTVDTSDSVEVTYFDESTWRPRTLSCKLPTSSALKPAKVELFGVTNREHAYREGVYMAAANRYRRTIIKFATEMEGFIPSYGDLVAINHDLPQWGQHADVVGYDDVARTLTLSEPVTWGTGAHYVGLRRRDGSVSGPYAVTQRESLYELTLSEDLDFTPYTGQEEERTHLVFGWGDTWRQLARVISVRPKDENTVEITCVNEDDSVHTADQGITAPAANRSQLPATPSSPRIEGLTARSSLSDEATMIISWQPSPGADRYLIEQSADGMSWTRTGETTANNYTSKALYGSQTKVRICASGQIRGSWVTVNFALLSDYMWDADSGVLMWSADSNLMWR
jgi:hypothetical protein